MGHMLYWDGLLKYFLEIFDTILSFYTVFDRFFNSYKIERADEQYCSVKWSKNIQSMQAES
jgi:hypothetical protein